MGAVWGFVDKTGAWALAPGSPEADARLEYSTSNKETWKPEGDWAEIAGVAEGVALVRDAAGWRFVDKAGKPLGRGVFEAAGMPGEGLAPVLQGGEWGFYDTKAGRMAIQPQFGAALPFKDGRAAVKIGAGWGYVDRTGSPVADAVWEEARTFSDKLGAVRKGGRWGFVDTKGKVVIEPRFDDVGAFREGLAPAAVVKRAPVAFGPTPGVRLRPRQGLQHWVFEKMGAEDALQVALGFDALSTEQQDALSAILSPYGRASVAESWAWIEVSGLPHLRQDVSTAMEAILEAGLPLREAGFARIRDGEVVADPFGGDDALEDPTPLAAASLDDGSSAIEVRAMLPWFPDVRIEWGLLPAETGKADARTKEIVAALGEALASAFADVWHLPGHPAPRPIPLSSRGEPHAVDRISHDGRAGWLFGVSAGDLEQLVGPGRVRWRDAELFEAVVAVVRTRKLAREISWERRTEPLAGGKVTPVAWLFQLWET
jgi:hypothetical protein